MKSHFGAVQYTFSTLEISKPPLKKFLDTPLSERHSLHGCILILHIPHDFSIRLIISIILLYKEVLDIIEEVMNLFKCILNILLTFLLSLLFSADYLLKKSFLPSSQQISCMKPIQYLTPFLAYLKNFRFILPSDTQIHFEAPLCRFHIAAFVSLGHLCF